MAGKSYSMFGWSWTEVSVLGSQVFGRGLMESCGMFLLVFIIMIINYLSQTKISK